MRKVSSNGDGAEIDAASALVGAASPARAPSPPAPHAASPVPRASAAAPISIVFLKSGRPVIMFKLLQGETGISLTLKRALPPSISGVF
ncbi:MAG: hypothetical protein EVA70_08425 [Parvularculaceae bacterium]|nr:MAG: hypothetical protein EVA70_08425 [Parvularculaceae bacterium]